MASKKKRKNQQPFEGGWADDIELRKDLVNSSGKVYRQDAVTVPQIPDMFELEEWSDGDLRSAERALKRSIRSASDSGWDPRGMEFDLCYVQRELQIRLYRKPKQEEKAEA